MNGKIALKGDFTTHCLRGTCDDWSYMAKINILAGESKGSYIFEVENLTLNAPDLTTWSWGQQ